MATAEPTPITPSAKGRRAGGKDIFKLAIQERDAEGKVRA